MRADFNPVTSRFSFNQPELAHSFIQGGVAWVSYQRLISSRINKATFDGHESIIEEEHITDVHGSGIQRIIHLQLPKMGSS